MLVLSRLVGFSVLVGTNGRLTVCGVRCVRGKVVADLLFVSGCNIKRFTVGVDETFELSARGSDSADHVVTVMIVEVSGFSRRPKVRLGFDASREVVILREELRDQSFQKVLS